MKMVDDQRVDERDRARLERREEPAVDADEHDHRQRQRPDALARGLAQALRTRTARARRARPDDEAVERTGARDRAAPGCTPRRTCRRRRPPPCRAGHRERVDHQDQRRRAPGSRASPRSSPGRARSSPGSLRLTIAGNMIEPTAISVTGELPEIAAKTMHAATAAMPSPPGSQPSSARVNVDQPARHPALGHERARRRRTAGSRGTGPWPSAPRTDRSRHARSASSWTSGVYAMNATAVADADDHEQRRRRAARAARIARPIDHVGSRSSVGLGRSGRDRHRLREEPDRHRRERVRHDQERLPSATASGSASISAALDRRWLWTR